MQLTFDQLMRLSPDQQVEVNRHRDRYFSVRLIQKSERPRALPRGLDLEKSMVGGTGAIEAFMEANRVVGLLVLKDGEVRLERYGLGHEENSRWTSFSIGKSVTGILVGIALEDGHIGTLQDLVTHYLPELTGSAYGECSVGHLLTMSSGIAWREAYRDGQSDITKMYESILLRRKGGVVDLLGSLPRAAAPGTQFLYSTGETHLLGEIVARAAGKPLATYLSERVWSRFGMEADGYWTLESPDGQELAGGGANFILRDYGRFGQFVLEGGKIEGIPIVPATWISEGTNDGAAGDHLRAGRLSEGHAFGYGYQWWLYPRTGGKWPEHNGAFTAMGIFGQFLYINPAERVVIAILSAWPDPWMAEQERRVHEFMAATIRALRVD